MLDRRPFQVRLAEAREEKNRCKRRALDAEEQRDALLTALQGEVDAHQEKAKNRAADAAKLKRDRSRHRFEGAARTHRLTAERLQKILDTHGGDRG